MSRGRFGLALQAVGDRLYAIGGRDSGAGNYLDNESYDPWQDRWFARRNQPTYRHSCGSAVVNDRIYVSDSIRQSIFAKMRTDALRRCGGLRAPGDELPRTLRRARLPARGL